MKALLEDLRRRIAAQVLVLGGEKAVHLLADENLLPETTPFPCVGLKEGPVVHRYNLGLARQKKIMAITVCCYVQLTTYETVIIGKNNQPGIIDLTDLVRACLEGYKPEGYRWNNGEVNETASQTLSKGDEDIQKKTFTMEWTSG